MAARALLALAALAACGGAQRPPTASPLEPVVLDRLDGGNLDLSDLVGRPVVLFFFTTYSGPAQAIAPFVSQVAIRHARDVAFVGVALEPGNAPIVQAWRDFLDPPFPVLIADEDLVAGRSALGTIPAVPAFAFIAANGAVVGWDVRLLRESELERIVRRLLE
ncbi:MAG: TlpA family protein disulfide reductase [Deltaproteobacteria bacterium]|nr:TlpA family protein disulfide reductase [Deltaproteobacteria bacterium]